MKKTLKEIQKNRPDIADEVAELAEELDLFSALDIVAVSEGGKIMIDNLVTDIVSLVETLAGKYKTESHIVMISQCADLKSKLDILRSFTRAGKKKGDLKDILEEKLKE